jgi:4-amino-4-deoxy-L-arabinose transferase-like glycosyltransferase
MRKQSDGLENSSYLPFNPRAMFYALVILFSAIALYTFKDYGTTWDEEVQFIYGEYIIRWYQTFFSDRSATNFSNLYVYGGLFDTVANLAIRVSPVGIFETRHLVNAAFGLLGIVAVWKIGVLISGRATGFAAALLLLLTPAYYGHSFFNPKDIPFAALATLAVYFILRSARNVPRVPVSMCVKVGLALGSALAVRVGGSFLVGYLVLFWFARLLWTRPSEGNGWLRPVMACLGRICLVIMVAWPTMLLFWPWAQLSPFRGPIEAFRVATRFPWDGLMLFRGEIVSSLDLPWDYLPTWFLLTLPEAVFVGCLAGIISMGFHFSRERLTDLRQRMCARCFLR